MGHDVTLKCYGFDLDYGRSAISNLRESNPNALTPLRDIFTREGLNWNIE